ncbi:MAG: response regulator [Chitinophagaceae bacterium]|nr:response regulator [Chitinophagaceae bacterium]
MASDLTRILIIDDDEDDFLLTSDYIRRINDKKFQIDWCYKFHEALQKVDEHLYDLYFVDYYLGAKTGLDLIKQAVAHHCDEPIVLLTGKGTQAIDREAMQAGATDYLVKSELTVEKVERCIRYSLERCATLKALRHNERKYRTIFERSKDAVIRATEELQFIDVNDASSLLLKYSKPELLRLRLYDILSPEEGMFIRQQLQEKGMMYDWEAELITKDGEKKNCILSLSTETDGIKYIHGMLHDITHIKKAEKATLQAEKLASAGRLVQTLAHEVRNPLNNINLSVEQLLHELQNNAENNIYLEIIQRNSKRIGDIITELLNSSRPAEMYMERKPLQAIMDESIAIAIDRLTLQRVKLQIRYSNEPAWIMADSSKLKIAFLNIIINAIEAMQEEKGLLEIIVDSSNHQHTVKINDNGSGISEENLSRLFEPYFTSKRNGLGLGLAATLNILQSHKARIEVASAIGRGTFFTITFQMG